MNAQKKSQPTNTAPVAANATLKSLFGNIFEGDVGEAVIQTRTPGEHTPRVDERYVFELEDIRLMLIWDSQRAQYNRNLMVNGPMGSGKTQLIFQFAARMGREVFRYSCHERTDFADLTGTMIIKPDGSTAFQDGPLVLAMKRGGLFLLDEVNAARPGTLIGMNGVLDGAPSITLPGSGEVVTRHEDFRIAVTGNSVTRDDTAVSFRGTQSMNTAFMDRFFVINKGYLNPTDETKALQTYLQKMILDPMLNPNGVPIPSQMTSKLVAFAGEVRAQFMRSECDTTVSTRGLFAFCELLAMRWSKVPDDPTKEMKYAANTTLFGKTAGLQSQSLIKAFENQVVSGLRFMAPNGAKPSNAATKTKASTAAVTPMVYMRINPNRQGNGEMAVWGFVNESGGNLMSSTQCIMFNGMLTGSSPRLVKSTTKTGKEAKDAALEKEANRGYVHEVQFSLLSGYDDLNRFYDVLLGEINRRNVQQLFLSKPSDGIKAMKEALSASYNTAVIM